MPRGRGGVVQGTPGNAHPNRTDLMGAVPVAVAPGQEYGKRAEQQAAQSVIPVAAPPVGAPTSPTPPQGAPTGAPTPQPITPPGIGKGNAGLGLWTHPSERPNEPITAGLATGAGPGPEVLTGVGAIAANGAVESGTLKNLLGSLASSSASSSAIRDLAAVAGAG